MEACHTPLAHQSRAHLTALTGEWEEDLYPSFEILRSGRRGGKELHIAMPDFIWRPREELWGQALDILNRLKHIRGGTE